MPRYFFHLRDKSGTLLDIEGSVHPDAEAATAEGVRQAREIMRKTMRNRGELAIGDRIEITDATETIVATVRFADSLSVIWGDAPGRHTTNDAMAHHRND